MIIFSEMPFIVPFRLILGIALLVIGGRLYWLFLGSIGFVFASDFAEQAIHGQPHSVVLIIAMFAGILGAMLAVFLKKIAVLAGGFVAGGYFLIELLKTFSVRIGDYHWVLFIVGGLAGAVLMSVAFGWTLIILSSLMGSILILQNFHFGHQLSEMVFICLVILGIAVQSGLIKKKSSP
jgi:hypothetical protein